MSVAPTAALPHFAARLKAGQAVKITLFGSSTTEGIGASSPEHGYAAIIEGALAPYAGAGLTIINRGIGGNGAAEMHDRLGSVLADHADLVIWQGGTNDAWQGVPVEAFCAQTREDLLRIRAGGADIALIGPQWCKMLNECPAFAPFVSAVDDLGAQISAPVFPRYEMMKRWSNELGLSREELSPDGLHMGDAGYALLGRAIVTWLLDIVGASTSVTAPPHSGALA